RTGKGRRCFIAFHFLARRADREQPGVKRSATPGKRTPDSHPTPKGPSCRSHPHGAMTTPSGSNILGAIATGGWRCASPPATDVQPFGLWGDWGALPGGGASLHPRLLSSRPSA